ncbi:hypothetical protein QR680_015952 [Steinernema hermaphroditum]|uniref:Uncharacterized protein n=1 Tax=Steinernema hermaphroditum TaxID=289476 RepID=A0AA39H9J2_9BILA|nr:hypothetical protein QR680_015952 [Steinernema hermaphroditum]
MLGITCLLLILVTYANAFYLSYPFQRRLIYRSARPENLPEPEEESISPVVIDVQCIPVHKALVPGYWLSTSRQMQALAHARQGYDC